jgi:glycine cleavage system H protein
VALSSRLCINPAHPRDWRLHDEGMLVPTGVGDLHYRRSRFATRLLTDRLYTASHFWAKEERPGVWRVGLTKFAARMLGDVVDVGFETPVDSDVRLGDAIGWFEGFKARSDLYCVVSGRFLGGNPALVDDVDVIDRDRWEGGWLYAVEGHVDPEARDAQGYIRWLDAVIDKMRGKETKG